MTGLSRQREIPAAPLKEFVSSVREKWVGEEENRDEKFA